MDRTEPTFKNATPTDEAHSLFYPAHYGAVYTRPWVADFVLNLAGYDSGDNLVDTIAVEPACGNGAFLEPMVRRLSASCQRQGRALQDCSDALVACDVNPQAVAASKKHVEAILLDCGWDFKESRDIACKWIQEADFLLDPSINVMQFVGGAGFVLGNPPYVRLESIDSEVADTYRKLYKSMTGRADLYVGFYERALDILAPDGVCGFICADRWMLNQYGTGLRKLITNGDFAVEAIVEMHTADAFYDEVLAYPAITVIRRAKQDRTLVAKVERKSSITVEALVKTAQEIQHVSSDNDQPAVRTTNWNSPARADTFILRNASFLYSTLLKVGGTSVAKSRVQPAGVVEGFQIVKDCRFRRLSARKL